MPRIRAIIHVTSSARDRPQWVSCSPCGDPFTCADNVLYYCSPKLWVPLPEWMK